MKFGRLALASACIFSLVQCSGFKSRILGAKGGPSGPQPQVDGKGDAQSQAYIDAMKAKKSEIKPTQSEFVVLPNGLKMMLVSDPAAQKAAVCVRVGAGFLNEKPGYRGLAHYLEHVLFLGSQKYPTPDEFMDLVEQRQGQTNANTTDNETKYIAAVDNKSFPEILDRLADFFRAPLFDQSFVKDQLDAIQSEYDKNIANQGFRDYYLSHLLYSEKSSYHWSFQGNNETLGKVPRKVMVDFFNRYYSANNITVAIAGSQSLAELKRLATAAFSGVPVRGGDVSKEASLPKKIRELPAQFVQAQSAEDQYTLSFSYTMPPIADADWQSKSFTLLGNVLAEESEGSLADSLKQKGWISREGAYATSTDPLSSELEISLSLTNEGYAHWREIASGLLAYMGQAQKTLLTHDMFENAKRSSELAYLFASPSPFDRVQALAQAIPIYGGVDTAERMMLFTKNDPASYSQTVSNLSPKNLDVLLTGPDIKGEIKSEFYDFSYTKANLADQEWAKNVQALPGLTFKTPVLNPYLPQNLEFQTVADKNPQNIVKDDLISTSLMRDNAFKDPTGFTIVRFQAGPEFKQTAEDTMLNTFFSSYEVVALNRWSAMPASLGYSFSMATEQTGFRVSFSGFSEKLNVYMQEFFSRLFQSPIDPAIFARVKEDTLRGIANQQIGDAYLQAVALKESTSNPFMFTDKDQAALASEVTAEKLEDFRNRVLASGQIQVFAYGNLKESDMKGFSSWLRQRAPETPSLDVQKVHLALAPMGLTTYQATRSGANNVWLSEVQLGEDTIDNIAAAEFLDPLISMPFFTHMRTVKKYGYIAGANRSRERRYVSMSFLVQSISPSLEVATEGRRWLNDEFLKSLKAVDAEQFEKTRASLLNELRALPESAEAKFKTVSNPFLYPGYPTQEDVAGRIEKMSQQDVVSVFENAVIGPKRHEFSVLLDSTAGGTPVPVIPASENVVPTLQDYWKKTAP